jgi:hypothetical protein
LWDKLKACEIVPNLSNVNGNSALKTFDSTKPEEEVVAPAQATETPVAAPAKEKPAASTNVASAPKSAIKPSAEFDSQAETPAPKAPAAAAAIVVDEDDDEIDDLPF